MGIVNTAAQQGLRAWGSELSRVAAELPPDVDVFKMGIDEALGCMGGVDIDVIRTSGYELSQLFAPRNDNLCGQKALLAVHATAQRALGGDMRAAMSNLALEDGRLGAVLTAFDPRGVKADNGSKFLSHSAALFRDHSGQGWVYDPITAKSPDGILKLEDWRRIVQADPDKFVVTSALDSAPTEGSIGTSMPHFINRSIAAHDWPGVTEPLVDSWNALAYDQPRRR